jgi:Flp pilus assembly protein TadD
MVPRCTRGRPFLMGSRPTTNHFSKNLGRSRSRGYDWHIMRIAGPFPSTFKARFRTAVVALGVAALAGCSTGPTEKEKSELAMIKAGDAARDGGDVHSAAALYRQAAEIAPKDPTPLDRLATLLMKAGDYGGALQVLQANAQRDPDNPGTNRKLGKVELALGKPEQALTYFMSAQKKQGDDAQIWNGLGVAYDSLAQHGQAQADYQKGMKLAPDNLAIKNNYGLSQALAGDYQGAIATLKAVAEDPRATPRYRQNLALAYGLAGDYVNASIAARKDISDTANASNQKYYALLRGMSDADRTRAILGSEFGQSEATGGDTVTGPGGDSDKVPVEQHALPH